MDAAQMSELFCRQFGIRVGAATSAYVHRRLQESGSEAAAPLYVMGGDARTGTPIRRLLSPEVLTQLHS